VKIPENHSPDRQFQLQPRILMGHNYVGGDAQGLAIDPPATSPS
jgi:hypothetical protein